MVISNMLINSSDVHKVHRVFFHFNSTFYDNNARKNYFLATCFILVNDIDLDFVDEKCPFGGIIGCGNSNLEKIFRYSKIFRLHAILHDASGFIKREFNKGPGYCYAFKCPINCCLLGHVTGIAFCLYLKFFKSTLYNNLLC